MQFAKISISLCLLFLASSTGAARKRLSDDEYNSGRLISPQLLISKLSKLQGSSSSSTETPTVTITTTTSTFPTSTTSTSPTSTSPLYITSTIATEAADEPSNNDIEDDYNDLELNNDENRQEKDYVRALRRQQLRNRQRAQLRAQQNRRRQEQKRRQQQKRRQNQRLRKQALKKRTRQQSINNQRRRSLKNRRGKKNIVRRVVV